MKRSRPGSFPREGAARLKPACGRWLWSWWSDRASVGLLSLLAVACLESCTRSEPEAHPGWVLHSQVKFFSADFQVPSEALPRSGFRLSFPYIAGDLYGPATTGDFIHPTLSADLSFDIDFGRVQQDLVRELQPTEFSLDYLRIDPANARIARLAPLALQPDGIDQVATVDWVDGATHERLMLVYVDRPCRITGALIRNDYTVRYNVRAPAAGYIWIGHRKTDDGEQMYTEVPKPEIVYLALTPAVPAVHPPPPSISPLPASPSGPITVPQKVALPTRKDIPAP